MRRPARILAEDVGQFGAILAAAGGRELNLVILSALVAAPEVASYALADRVRVLMVGLVAPVTQALFLAIVGRACGAGDPRAGERPGAARRGLRRGAVSSRSAGRSCYALGGGALPGAVPVLQVLCLLPFLTGLTAILGANTLLRRDGGTPMPRARSPWRCSGCR